MYKFEIFISFIFLYALLGCSPRTAIQKEARHYQKGRLNEDTSNVYQLPYELGTQHTMIQGYYSRHTHRYKAAVDFKMKIGTPICAVADGIIMRIKDDSNLGGFNKKYKPDANYIIIQHDDSTRSSYRHLMFHGVMVAEGDTVRRGMIIGKSGNTGYTFTPHLHFMISKYKDGQWMSTPCRFISKSYKGYLRPWHRYESINSLAKS